MDQSQHNRLFIAIFPDENMRSYLRDSIRTFSKDARNFNFVPIDQLHLTLEFLGNSVSNDSLELLTEALQQQSGNFAKPKLTLSTLNFGFPSQNMPSLLFWDIVENKELKDLTTQVHDIARSLNVEDIKRYKDHAKLIHHITIARTKRGMSRAQSRAIKAKIEQTNFGEAPSFEPQHFSLVASTLNAKGSTYKEIQRIAL